MKILKLNQVPILEQLRIEEALLRADKGNWCLVNTGAPPAIVMGISGKPHALLDIEKVKRDGVPVIKRFSGGGTVYIDPKTVFVTFICNSDAVSVPPQPKPILEWSEKLYQPLFKGFKARENDYVLGEKKFGGNAQYIQKGRWLHHTSFLWDYDPAKMEYLLMPERRPQYRRDRSHGDFLCTLRSQFAQKEEFVHALCARMTSFFIAETVHESVTKEILARPHRKASTLLNLGDL